MASSTVSVATVNRDQVIERVLRILGVIKPGESPQPEDVETISQALNAMIQAWTAAKPPRLPWTRVEKSVSLSLGQSSVTLGPGGQLDDLRPLQVLSAWLVVPGQADQPLTRQTEREYEAIENKTRTGDPLHYTYKPEIPLGKLLLWPVVAAVGRTLKLLVSRPLYDFTASGDTPDFPREWDNAIVWNCALENAHEFDVPEARLARIERMAQTYLTAALGG